VLVWVDDAYALINQKMDLELGHYVDVDFGNPDFVTYAHRFGTKGYWMHCEALPERTQRRHHRSSSDQSGLRHLRVFTK
jgi:thiamine pyrophosphate-dependent acetolactate synthase large subunit-like protein